MNTLDFLNIATSICPDKAAIIFEGKKMTFAQLNARVNRLANGLANLGIKKGDRVAFLQVNCPACVEVYFAVTELGAIYVPLNFRAKGHEISYILNSSESGTIVVGDRYVEMVNSFRVEV